MIRHGVLEFRYVLGSGEAAPCVGFAVARRTGSAVVRNKLRRRLRAVMRELSDPGRQPSFPSGDYLIRPRPGAADAAFSRLRRDAEQVLERIRRREGLA